eukprot:COSAG02_NODE_62822_length_265_cov_0.421687_1_plen_51_part_01
MAVATNINALFWSCGEERDVDYILRSSSTWGSSNISVSNEASILRAEQIAL